MRLGTLLLTGGILAVTAGPYTPRETCLAAALPRSESRPRKVYNGALLRNCDPKFNNYGHVLQALAPVCYANMTYFYPCDTTVAPESESLEWHQHVMGTRLSPTDFSQMLATHESDWLRGTTYGTAILYFPHAAYALLMMLSLPLLGEPVDHFLVNHFSNSGMGGRTWQQHYDVFHKTRWLTDLASTVQECLGVTTKRGDEAFFYDYNAASPVNPLFPPRPAAPRLLCFDKVFIPYNQNTCHRFFVDDARAPGLWAAFRQHVFRRYRVRPAPTGPLRIGFMERTRDRRILNQAEVIAAITQETGLPVTVLRFDSSMGLDVQVRSVAGVHLLIGPHGANLMNALFVSPGAAVIEIYTRNYSMGCYYGDVIQGVGIPYHRFCGPSGPCHYTVLPGGQYDRSDVTIDASALTQLVKRAVDQIKADIRRRRRQRPAS